MLGHKPHLANIIYVMPKKASFQQEFIMMI